MMKLKLIGGLVSTGLLASSAAILGSANIAAPATQSVSAIFASSNNPGPSQAETIAIQHVGGGQVTHISSDTYQGQAVYDIHILHQNTLYDVKISKSTGSVVQTKLSSEQPTAPISRAPSPSGSQSSTSVSSNQAGQLAVKAVGGGSVMHISSDHYHNTPVWDVHVQYQNQIWDVKISQATGSAVEKFLSPEQGSQSSPSQPSQNNSPDHQSQSNKQDQQDQQDHHSQSAPSSPSSGIVYGKKLTVPPASYQQYVNQALQQENGTLKWVKLIQKHGGEIQANIKIRRNQGGTVKIKDLFSSTGQLLQGKANH